MEINKGFVDPEIEKKVLINILNSFEDLEYVTANLPTNSFQELVYQRLHNLICRYYNSYFKIMPQEALEIQLVKESYSSKEQNEVLVVFLDFSGRSGDDNTHFYVDTLKDLYVKRSLYQVHLELKNGLENPTRVAEELLSDTTSRILDASQAHSTGEIMRTTITGDPEARWTESSLPDCAHRTPHRVRVDRRDHVAARPRAGGRLDQGDDGVVDGEPRRHAARELPLPAQVDEASGHPV